MKLTLSWLKGAQTIEATTVAQLEKSKIRIGDTLRLKPRADAWHLFDDQGRRIA